ncbi:MAG: M36 family metallopeptidase, partial [Anaerolineae bacterium]|nr:M36 family metallopeptidase [Phycisphaerae bacterium]
MSKSIAGRDFNRNNKHRSNRWQIEPLERRQMLSAASDAALKASPLQNNLAAQFVPESTFLYRSGTYLTKPAAGQPLDIALNYFRANANAFNITAGDIGTPIVTDQYTDSDTGLTHIYLRQQVNGLEIANANANFNVRSDGRILSIGSTFVSGIAELSNQPIAPQLDASVALLRAGQNLSLRTTRQSQIIKPAIGTAQVTTLRNSDLSQDDIAGRLRYVVSPNDGVNLAWNFVLRAPGDQHWYDTSVNAADGSLMFTADWTSDGTSLDTPAKSTPTRGATSSTKPQAIGGTSGSLAAAGPEAAGYNASYNVYAWPKRNPDSGPRTIEANPWDPIASQFGWQDTNGNPTAESNVTAGNNVAAQEDADDNDTGGIQPSGGALGAGAGPYTFDYPLNLSSPPASNQSAAIVNLYYWNNIIHDIMFRYGFNEVGGNFQQMNYGGTGLGNDRVRADAQDGSGTNNANFSTPPDGQSGRMQMYIWNFASPSRDSSFDSEIIVHEYGHGVSNRLTGGPANSSALSTVQSAGMGEGWSDWWSLMLLQNDGSATALNGAHPTANYSIGEDPNGPSIRRYPYSFDKTINPTTFGLYNSSTGVHHTGELWATALWDLAVTLERKWGFNPNLKSGYVTSNGNGNILAMKLVMDALKIQPANPSFLQARDAILQADVTLTGGANQRDIWQSFARRGLGTSATTASTNSTTINEAFDVPATVSAPLVAHATPLSPLRLTANVSSMVFRFSETMEPTSFNQVTDVLSFTGPGAVDLKPSITTVAWSNSNKTLTINFAQQTAEGTYTMTIGPNIQSPSPGGQQMDQNLNNVPGEATDNFTATFVLDPTPGPDAFTYEASATTFQNINLASSGGTTILDNQDDTNASIPLGGNTFSFYGTTYSGSNQLFVNDNGLITFGSGSDAFANNNMTFSLAQPAIAALWDDWATDRDGSDKVLYSLDAPNNKLIIEWSAVVSRGDQSGGFGSSNATFQAILSLNTGSAPGEIVFNYVDLNVGANRYTDGGSASVGIKSSGLQGSNGNNSRLLLSLFNSTNTWLGDGKAVRIGLGVIPTTATVTGKVFEDRNGDGTQLAGENGIFDVTVFADANNNGALDGGESSADSDIIGS